MRKKLLFVDDEESIRVTLPAILEQEGFDVSVAASVPEALLQIQNNKFDILLSDLNIGEAGDGFIVVSAMRRIQPSAATFILTGYPDFESALRAIQSQVDDYLIKPADIKKLVAALKEKSARQRTRIPTKRISALIRELHDEIVERCYQRLVHQRELAYISMSRADRVDHIPHFLLEIAKTIETPAESLTEKAMLAAEEHGRTRRHQGYSIPMLLVESGILDKTTCEILQEHLLGIDISTLIPDLCQMSYAINCAVEASVRAYLAAKPKAA